MRGNRFFCSVGTLLTLLPLLLRPAYAGEMVADSAAEARTATDPLGQTLPEGGSAAWWATVQQDIRQSEYEITWQEQTYLPDVAAAYQAPNRAHNLRTYFVPEGIRVIPRTETEPSWELGLFLTGYGYAGDVQPVSAAELLPEGNRIEYRRGDIVEGYINDEQGLAQEFVVSDPLSVVSDQSSEAVLDWAIRGNLTPVFVDRNTTIEFIAADGTVVLRYGDFQATDAAGQELPLQAELIPVLDDQADSSADRSSRNTSYVVRIILNAPSYPVTIRARLKAPFPILDNPQGLSPTADWTAESDQASAYFGYSVNTAGDVNGDGYSEVIVGAYCYDNVQDNEGRAFLYYGSAAGLSTTPAWTAESDQADAYFGYSVGTAGDVNGDGYADVIVGAHLFDSGQDNEGRAFVYHGSATGLGGAFDWSAEGNQADAYLGVSVGTAGDVNGDGYSDVIVGAHLFDSGQTNEGAAFVYHGSAGGLGPNGTPNNADWSAESDQDYAEFGISVGTAGDVNGDGYADVIVGAHYYDNGQSNEGRAFVYHGSDGGLSLTPDWTAESNLITAEFGISVGTAGDVNGDGYADVIVGAHDYDYGQTDEGAAFVYHGSATGLSMTPDWTAESNQAYAYFGISVGTAGDVNGDGYADVIVGAHYYDNVQDNEGRASVFHGSPSGLSLTPDWTAESNQAYAYFGISVGTAGDVNGDGYADVIVGAYRYDNDQDDEGAAFVYHGSSAGLNTTLDWNARSDQDEAYFGFAAGTAGDVNGDGYADVIVGAPNYDDGQTDEGRAFVYHGSASGLRATPDWIAEGNQAEAYFGRSVGTAGDVNGDGYADVIIGAPDYNSGQTDEGAAFVYHGSDGGLGPDGTPDNADWIAEGDQDQAHFGSSVGAAGDVNGDGYADVIIGAPDYDNGHQNEGRAYVFLGSATGLLATAAWVTERNQAEAHYGQAVGTAGDVDGDGYSEVVVGAPDSDSGETDEGRAYLYHGSAGGLSTTPGWTAEANQGGARLGTSVGTAGDVNGDGYSEVIVGVPGYDNGPSVDEGLAYVYYGSAAGLDSTPGWTHEGGQGGAEFGYAAALAGDVNGDGYADVVVGAPNAGLSQEGRAYGFLGSTAGLATTETWIAESNQDQAHFGWSVGAAGDVNGDGYADVIVGAPDYGGPPDPDEGFAFLYYGNGGDGLDLLPRQMRTDGFAPIAPLGLSDSDTAMQLRLTGRMPLGRDEVKLEWQVAPLGTPFTASGIISGTSATWIDVLTTGVVITQDVTGLAPGTPYHWRVRLRYRPGNRLGQSAGRWMHMPWNGWSEQDFLVPVQITGLVASNDSPTALGSPTTLTATVASGSSVAYDWAFGDGISGTGAVLPHIYTATGRYTAVVTASNNLGWLTATTVVTVDEAIATLTATNDGPTVLGNPTTLTATATGGTNLAYAWAFGDGGFGSGITPTHVYPVTGLYTALVTASNSVSLLTATTTVVVDEAIAGLQAINDGPTALGDPTTLTATISSGGSNVVFTWALGDLSSGSGAVLTHTYGAVDTYTAMVTASNSINWLTATTVVIVNEAVAGLVAANDSPTILGNPTSFTATVTAGDPVSFTWAFGDGSFGDRAILTYTYPAPGYYAAVVTASNRVSLLTVTTAVTVDEVIAGLVASNDGPTALGNPTTLAASVAAGSNVVYDWAFGDGGFGSGATLPHTYPATGVYTATVTAWNSVSMLIATTVVTVDQAIAALTATNDSPTALGNPTTLTATAAGGSNVVYEWALDDGTFGVGSILVYTYTAAGLYNAVVTASNSVTLLTATTQVYVDEAISGLAAANDSPTALGSPTTLTATVLTGGGVVFNWDLGDGTFGSGTVLAHVYPAVGLYTAIVTASNSFGHEVTATTVVVEEAVTGLVATNNSPTRRGNPTLLQASVLSGTDVTFEWAFGDGITATEAVHNHIYAAAGVYTAVVTASNRVSLLTAVTIVLVEDVIAGLGADNDSPTVVGNTTRLWAGITSGSNVTFEWDLGDGTIAYGDEVIYVYGAVGFYTATVTAQNNVSLVTATTVVEIIPPTYYAFLPTVWYRDASAPDLVVESAYITADSATIVLRNIGNRPVVDRFWVDLYVGPDPVPTRVNQTWDQLCDQGLVWGVLEPLIPLAPGMTITLTYGDPYYWPDRSYVDWPLPTGTGLEIYVQADSANVETDYGAVLEIHEILLLEPYNNISGPYYVVVGGVNLPPSKVDIPPYLPENLPPRPDRVPRPQ